MIVVTPSLWVAEDHDVWAPPQDVFYVTTAEEAIHSIAEGATALIPFEDWEEIARRVLARFNASPERIDFAINFAKGDFGQAINAF